MTTDPITIRRATADDVPAVATVLAEAFADDPVWGWAYPIASDEPQRVAPVWALWARGAVANDSLWVTPACEAVSVWVPPGASELTEDDEPRFESLTVELAGARAPQVLAAMHQFEDHHPPEPPHHYLSLLGTANAHRGRGIGMALMAAVLDRIDAEGGCAYLESTNPAANDRRYARVGFEPHGSFTIAAAGATVNTMWRPARTGAGH